MEFFNRIAEILRKPFPEVDSLSTVFKQIAAISIFITIFLYAFQPGEVRFSRVHPFLICLGFGGITFVISFIYEFLVTYVFRLKAKGKSFTFGRWILYAIGVLFCLGMANFLYSSYLNDRYRWESLTEIIFNTFVIGIIPMVALGAVILWNEERKYLLIANEINQQNPTDTTDKHDSDQVLFDIPAPRIRYIEALQNYVKIGYLNAENQLIEQTERATLKSVLDEVKENSIVKCHRSFLVNRNTIISTSGNAQGLVLSLAGCDKTIPVSRTYVPSFRHE